MPSAAPDSELTRGHPVTLRGLLSMTGGIGVPGYLGYVPGTPLPNLRQILNGEAPANSPPVRVAYVPGTRFAYSGGGYQVVGSCRPILQRRALRAPCDGLQACGVLIGFLIGAYLADAIGRKWTFMISAVATIIMVLVYLYVPIGDTGLLLLGILLNASILMKFAPMGPYMTELYPTDIRGTGQGSRAR